MVAGSEEIFNFMLEQFFEGFLVIEVDVVVVGTMDDVGNIPYDDREIVLFLMIVLEGDVYFSLKLPEKSEEDNSQDHQNRI